MRTARTNQMGSRNAGRASSVASVEGDGAFA